MPDKDQLKRLMPFLGKYVRDDTGHFSDEFPMTTLTQGDMGLYLTVACLHARRTNAELVNTPNLAAN